MIFLRNTSKDPRSETLIYCCNLLELLNFGSPLGGQALEKWVPISFPGCGHSAINQVETSDAIAKASTGAPAKLAARWHWVSLDPIRRHLSRSLIESIVTPHDRCFKLFPFCECGWQKHGHRLMLQMPTDFHFSPGPLVLSHCVSMVPHITCAKA